jgi:hypothetical protein
MAKVKANSGKAKGAGVTRDKEGKPKMSRAKAFQLWSRLSEQDREQLKSMYPDLDGSDT